MADKALLSAFLLTAAGQLSYGGITARLMPEPFRIYSPKV
jgi:hypothetical protein